MSSALNRFFSFYCLLSSKQKIKKKTNKSKRIEFVVVELVVLLEDGVF
jgi:hypothetical protein